MSHGLRGLISEMGMLVLNPRVKFIARAAEMVTNGRACTFPGPPPTKPSDHSGCLLTAAAGPEGLGAAYLGPARW